MDITINGVKITRAVSAEPTERTLQDSSNSFVSASGLQIQPVIAWKRDYTIEFGLRTDSEIENIITAISSASPAAVIIRKRDGKTINGNYNVSEIPAKVKVQKGKMSYYTLSVTFKEV